VDPIHTVRPAKRLHLKNGVFVSLAPPSVAAGNLRVRDGAIAWLGPPAAVERGESVLEVWGQLVLPGLAIAGVDPIAMALRAVAPDRSADARAQLERADAETHRALARQALAECAVTGVLHPIVDARGATLDRAKGVVAAFEDVGVRGAIEWEGGDLGIADHPHVRVARPAPRAGFASIVKGAPIPAGARLGAEGGPPDAWSCVRAAEARERGLGLRLLAATYAALAEVWGRPFGAFVRGAAFDVLFLDYEVPGELGPQTLDAFLREGPGAWNVEVAAIGGLAVVKRHELQTLDREEIARGAAEALRSVVR